MNPTVWPRAIRPVLLVALTAVGACAAGLVAISLFAQPAATVELRVLKGGLGTGTITSTPAGIACGADCSEPYTPTPSTPPATVTLTALADADSVFAGWDVDPDADRSTGAAPADCTGTATTCTLTMNAARSVRPMFNLAKRIPTLTDMTPDGAGNPSGGIRRFLNDNPDVNSAARFVAALNDEFKQNWILMARSESLQTGTAEMPRILMPNKNAEAVFTIGMAKHSSYPGAHPDAIEYMQWDAAQKNFRFHEIVVKDVEAMNGIEKRPRGISIDDERCTRCHSTRNILNLDRSVTPAVPGSRPGTDGITAGTVQVKNKPNWDAYDSWGGMLPFNRDRIFEGSVEAAAFRRVFNPWTWRNNDAVRAILEQLRLQPDEMPQEPKMHRHAITRVQGGANDGRVRFAFDPSPAEVPEPLPACTENCPPAINSNYSFDAKVGTGPMTQIVRDGKVVVLHHMNDPKSESDGVEGRAVEFFDTLGGFNGPALPKSNTRPVNAQRVADEMINHRVATGNFPVDIRPIALAIITDGCLAVDEAANRVESTPALTIDLAFFDARNGMKINELIEDTRKRTQSLPRRKADIQRFALSRDGDPYIKKSDPAENPQPEPTKGLIEAYGASTTVGGDTSMGRLRQEVFRRTFDGLGGPDSTEMGGIYVDREDYLGNTELISLYRYFLEPLGVAVDKWSMSVRGRSRTYTFADVFGQYTATFKDDISESLKNNPSPGLASPPTLDCGDLISAVNTTLGTLPAANEVPRYTDVQRIFNKSCIECHGGLDYPPYSNFPNGKLNLSENEKPSSGQGRLNRPHREASIYASILNARINQASENCPSGMMPCGGPPLSKTDIETFRRWRDGGKPLTYGDPHITTIDGTSYDFQSAGEFVMLRDENFEVQTRQTAIPTAAPLPPNAHTGLASCVSINTAVAMRVGGHRITYQQDANFGGERRDMRLRVDGKPITIGEEGFLFDGGRIVRTAAPGGVQVEAPGGSKVTITPGWWEHHRLWYLNIDTERIRATDGVMGVISRGQWLPALPDGRLLGPRPGDAHQRYVDLYETFEKAWRVTDSTSLFDYDAGTSTSTFTIDVWPAENAKSCDLPPGAAGLAAPKTPASKPLTRDAAQKLCTGVEDTARREHCIQDVMVTGEPSLAQSYVQTDSIARDTIPVAPVLASPQAFTQGVEPATIEFTWNKTAKANADPLRYRHCIWDVRTRFSFNACSPVTESSATVKVLRRTDMRISLGWTLLLLAVAAFLFWRGVAAMHRPRPLSAMLALAILPSIAFAIYGAWASFGMLSQHQEGLRQGHAYYWKVIAEDGKGSSVESETRRFDMQR